MRLTEKEHETLPVDVSHSYPDHTHFLFCPYRNLSNLNFFSFSDRITDVIVVCDDLLWYCPHRRRVQRHGRLLGAEKQVSPAPPMMYLFISCRDSEETQLTSSSSSAVIETSLCGKRPSGAVMFYRG